MCIAVGLVEPQLFIVIRHHDRTGEERRERGGVEYREV